VYTYASSGIVTRARLAIDEHTDTQESTTGGGGGGEDGYGTFFNFEIG